MATLKLTGKTTVAKVKKAFNEAFGSQIKLYKGGSVAEDTAILSDLGLKKNCVLNCRSSLTAGSFIKRMEVIGLKVTIWTKDFNVKVLDGLTLESTGKVKNMAVKKDMEDLIAYQRANETSVNKSEETSTKPGDNNGKLNTYYIRVEADRCWRFDTIELKADDDTVSEGFEYEDPWTCIVGETTILSCLKDDLDCGEEIFGYDEEDSEALKENILENDSLHIGDYFPNIDDSFNIVIMDENKKTIETVESSQIACWCIEQGAGPSVEDEDIKDEYGENEPLIKKYIDNNKEDAKSVTPAYPVPKDKNKWYWLNAQDCGMEEYAVYKLEISGKFDPNKLLLKTALIEDCVDGMISAEVVTAIVYDGEIVKDQVEDADSCEEKSINCVIKQDQKYCCPYRIYDMTFRNESGMRED